MVRKKVVYFKESKLVFVIMVSIVLELKEIIAIEREF